MQEKERDKEVSDDEDEGEEKEKKEGDEDKKGWHLVCYLVIKACSAEPIVWRYDWHGILFN